MSSPDRAKDAWEWEEPTCLLCRNLKDDHYEEGEVTLCPYCDAMTPTKWRLPVEFEREHDK